MTRHRTTARAVLFFLLLTWVVPATASAHQAKPKAAAEVPERIVFPVVGPSRYQDDFGAARAQGGHEGNDIMAERMQPAVAAEAGTVRLWTRSWRAGCMLYLHGKSGTTYLYVHLNNDRSRKRNDNRATDCSRAFAPGLASGDKVRAGELVGYVGDSGDANGIHPHLHFELHPGGGGAVSPFRWLERARHALFPVERDDGEIKLALYGEVRAAEGDRLKLRINRVRTSQPWRADVRRTVVLSVPDETIFQRNTGNGREPAQFAGLEPGTRVVVWTTWFEPSLRRQLARANALETARVLVRRQQ